jgi:hypothetical protein
MRAREWIGRQVKSFDISVFFDISFLRGNTVGSEYMNQDWMVHPEFGLIGRHRSHAHVVPQCEWVPPLMIPPHLVAYHVCCFDWSLANSVN